jgi:putative cardiolipin synthase
MTAHEPQGTGVETRLSGLVLLDDNADAFCARLLSAREAALSLDLMYYVWRLDTCGRALLCEVIRAADRGVQVRLLIDDINPAASDEAYRLLDGHPNIQLKLFNPSAIRRRGPIRWAEWVFRFGALNRRMHAKAWIADGRLAVVGGRNIGDEYFGQANTNFRDLDLLVLGSAVEQTTRIFEEFWNHGLARPVQRVRSAPGRGPVLRDLLAFDVEPERLMNGRRSIEEMIATSTVRWIDKVRVIADPPDKARGRLRENWLMKAVLPMIRDSRRRLDIISPYFIPGARGVDILRGLARRGVVVTVLTNSLAATDVAAVHGAYANYRRRLLRAGINLFEFQPFDGRNRISVFGSKGASLHTKAFTVDSRIGFVGSFNFDPRSVSLNVEMGILFEDEVLVRTLEERVDQEKQADASYWLSLDRGMLRWTGEHEGRLKQFRGEPEATLTRRLVAAIVRWLPIESHL